MCNLKTLRRTDPLTESLPFRGDVHCQYCVGGVDEEITGTATLLQKFFEGTCGAAIACVACPLCLDSRAARRRDNSSATTAFGWTGLWEAATKKQSPKRLDLGEEHAVAVAEEAITLAHGVVVGVEDVLATGEGADQH